MMKVYQSSVMLINHCNCLMFILVSIPIDFFFNEPNATVWLSQDDLTISMVDKCKQSLPVVQRIIETTSDDEVMLFDALNLHDELQLAISRHSELVAAAESAETKDQTTEEVSGDSKSNEATLQNGTTDCSKEGSSEFSKLSHQEEGADIKHLS